MRGSPSFLAWRWSKKARLTAGGIALCVAFAVLSFTVVGGLRGTTYAVSDDFQARAHMVSRSDLSPFDPLALGIREGTFVLLLDATLQDGRVITLAAFEARDLAPVPGDTLRPGPQLDLRGNVTIVEPAPLTLKVGAPLRLNASQDAWGIVSPGTLRGLDPSFGRYGVTYVLATGLPADERARLEGEGLLVSPVPAIVPFFDSGAKEVVADLWLVVAFSSILVGLLAFEFMHLETRARRREIGIWRSLGMRADEVLRILVTQAALLAGLGVVVGSAASLALVFAAKQATGLAILDPTPDPLLLAGVAGSILVATLAGAYFPASRAANAIVRESLEAR